ncbi:zinc finger BED domain-containing protein RICESLEEPER 1-like [Prunus avium]|uniref:Zinc finger BED domain-containing protein RICESLEEPER 1-like n=1 Tax=Prunus avium TaxID=42229 RepID=A0A6P5TWT9_PRUAV|nr:zinc finger BED domain-containing protein RICESLEEPER 1-like [Prunus avium]
MVLTAHFLDGDWMLHKRVLNFCVIQNHKGRTIGRLIEKCLIDWGIERVLTITLDNASANDKAVSYLQSRMKDWSNGDGVHLHMRCYAHIVNLIVTDGLKELHNFVKSIHDAAMWNSTYMMLEAALKFKKAFSRLEDEDGHFKSYFGRGIMPPVEEDWANVVVFVKFLKCFYDFTLRCSATLHATAHTIFHDLFAIDCELAKMSVVGNPLLSNMAQNMKLKYDKYWGSLDSVNQFLLIVVVLDPRYKLDNLSMHIADLYVENDAYVAEKTVGVKDFLFKLYGLYEAGFVSNPTQSCSSSTTSSSIGSSIVTDSSNSSSFGGDRKKAMNEKWKRRQEDKDAVVLSHEIDRYLPDAAKQDIKHFDILNWWRVNASKYPDLAAIARDVLAIPVSTVAS